MTAELDASAPLGSKVTQSIESDRDSSDEPDIESALRIFYASIFPFKRIYDWLSYDHLQKTFFSRREFSFTLFNNVYLRFHSFVNERDMAEKISRLCPIKIDIGAVYSARPSEKKSLNAASFKPVEKELIFDIDLTDYDDVRTCCQSKGICAKCWRLVVAAVQVIDAALREDFGFEHLLWVYSGRRGAHCWVADERARHLDSGARRAIVSYIELVKGGAEQRKKVNLGGSESLHPIVKRALRIIEPVFTESLLGEQDILTSEERWRRLLALVPDEALREALAKSWARERLVPLEKWNRLSAEVELAQKKKRYAVKNLKEEIMLQYCYPRLDANVSIGLNHLLKSPFCVHPDTGQSQRAGAVLRRCLSCGLLLLGRVCVPFEASQVEFFQPHQVPTVYELVVQAHAPASFASEEGPLASYFAIFDAFLKGLAASRQVAQMASKLPGREENGSEHRAFSSTLLCLDDEASKMSF